MLKSQAEVVVTMVAGHRGQKDDARDAWTLAESLRAGGIKRRVYKDRGPFSELRASVRAYTMQAFLDPILERHALGWWNPSFWTWGRP